ncbi:hypothetical protein ACE1CI_30125 [Aerosakkonemataceae cyanobacterium BLCC-F50]|uniref:Uncharacterized protein n=1 Tax=Floridaenema flaviceps BLCC-F50 TaxID=3153642 RepID=A0ABV4XZM6_9CYAN
MTNQLNLLPCALSDLFADVTSSGRITLADRYGLKAAILQGCLSEEEQSILDRLLYGVRRGRLQMVNEISAVM